MSEIPFREHGYSIESDTAVVHERYQDHAPRARRTSALGVTNVLDGRESVACPVCFPEPKAKRGKAVEPSPSEQYADAWTAPTQPIESVTVTSESEPA